MNEKNEIRKAFLKKRDSLTPFEIFKRSNKIITTLLSLKEFKEAKAIFLYISFGSEVNTHGLIRLLFGKKKVFVPVVEKEKKEIFISELKEWRELSSGAYGILEPKKEYIRKGNVKEIEIAVVPGIAFDEDGYRIGYGGGYYDKILKKMNGIKIGIAYDFQILKRMPHENHDVKMDEIVTEKRILSFR